MYKPGQKEVMIQNREVSTQEYLAARLTPEDITYLERRLKLTFDNDLIVPGDIQNQLAFFLNLELWHEGALKAPLSEKHKAYPKGEVAADGNKILEVLRAVEITSRLNVQLPNTGTTYEY